MGNHEVFIMNAERRRCRRHRGGLAPSLFGWSSLSHTHHFHPPLPISILSYFCLSFEQRPARDSPAFIQMDTPDKTSPDTAYILRLPYEILVDIVDRAALSDTGKTRFKCDEWTDRTTEWRQSCQQLFDISMVSCDSTTLLYSTLWINCTDMKV